MSNDNKSTWLGVVSGAVMATHIDWALLLKGDHTQISTLVGAVVFAAWGYYTNRKDASGSTGK